MLIETDTVTEPPVSLPVIVNVAEPPVASDLADTLNDIPIAVTVLLTTVPGVIVASGLEFPPPVFCAAVTVSRLQRSLSDNTAVYPAVPFDPGKFGVVGVTITCCPASNGPIED